MLNEVLILHAVYCMPISLVSSVLCFSRGAVASQAGQCELIERLTWISID